LGLRRLIIKAINNDEKNKGRIANQENSGIVGVGLGEVEVDTAGRVIVHETAVPDSSPIKTGTKLSSRTTI
jgi:hypothetical protein